MKQITAYIFEKIKELPNSVKGLIVFDIDDTILKVDPSKISIYKKEPGKQEVALSTDEFAKDPDAGDPDKKSWFDYRDFRDPVKVYNSIISGTPLIKNLKIMDDYIQAGYDFCFLTARSCEDTVKKALSDFLLVRDENGIIRGKDNALYGLYKDLYNAIDTTNWLNAPDTSGYTATRVYEYHIGEGEERENDNF